MLDSIAATEHRGIPAPGRAGAGGEQRCKGEVEASRGNPGSALWVYAQGGMGLFLCLPSLIWVGDDAKAEAQGGPEGGKFALITGQVKAVSEAG